MHKLLKDICYVRSGDKGNTCSIGLISTSPEHYPVLLNSVTPEKIKTLFGDWVQGEVHCYEMDNIQALMIVMEKALDGGATQTLRLDQTGKSLGQALLRLPIEDL